MSIEHRCCVCESGFPVDALNKEGQCSSCEELYPKAKSREDAMKLNSPSLELNPKMDKKTVLAILSKKLDERVAEFPDEKRIREIIKEILDDTEKQKKKAEAAERARIARTIKAAKDKENK